jgi:hypothetical protein
VNIHYRAPSHAPATTRNDAPLLEVAPLAAVESIGSLVAWGLLWPILPTEGHIRGYEFPADSQLLSGAPREL